MNAYELADELEKALKNNVSHYFVNKISTMLRQQADRIAELEAILELHNAMDKQCQSLMKQFKEITK